MTRKECLDKELNDALHSIQYHHTRSIECNEGDLMLEFHNWVMRQATAHVISLNHKLEEEL